MVEIEEQELKKLRVNYGTAKIVASILLIGFLFISATFVYVEMQFNKQMQKCNLQAKELYDCQNPKIEEDNQEWQFQQILDP